MRFLGILLLTTTMCLRFTTEVHAFELYISPMGNDGNPGTLDRPLASLQRANDVLERERPDEDVTIHLMSDQGTYEISHTVWTYSNRRWKTRISSYPDGSHARFTATEYTGEIFISFELKKGEPSNVEIADLSIEDSSCRVFLFNGDPENGHGWNGGNSITGCVFANIGNFHFPEKQVVYSVIGFVNSRNNVIRDCSFTNIKNQTAATYPQKRKKVGNRKRDKEKYPNILEYETSNRRTTGNNPNLPIIGIYFAHDCDSNQVINNTFTNVKGDVVRIRDNSNNLVFSGNTVVVSGWNAVITSWHRNEKNEDDGSGERPSHGVTVTDNDILGNWLYGMPTIFKDLTSKDGENIDYDYRMTIRNNRARDYMLPN